MKRREFMTLVGGAVVAWPLAARAQQNDRIKRIAVLLGATTEHDPETKAVLRPSATGLRNSVGPRGAIYASSIVLLAAMPTVSELRDGVGEVGSGSDRRQQFPVIGELKRATGTIPIVFAVVADPVGQGLVSSLARPGANRRAATVARSAAAEQRD
jgi:putative ABC transport system substrate-binding protein